jgi:ketosteroid isomerase-like protein
MSKENVEIVRREYEDFNRTGEVTESRYHQDFEFHDFEGAPRQIWRGIDGWREWARAVTESFGDLILEPEELLDLGDQVIAVVVMRGRGQSSGVDLHQAMPPFAVVWTLRDGKVLRGAAFRSKAEALEAAELAA